ncbi:MAG: hypothetical protein O3A93_08595 [Chloroflexi bacterium]|nr:hypothetical protein [Chloroflexota bacterium]MDA1271303.1 hypothetical protein [Chloroflexota bacterium]PKB58190.1 MAG: hypothetical protein BZY83_08375 [SAR202 cluster bacterium Casp-Chloro-G2]
MAILVGTVALACSSPVSTKTVGPEDTPQLELKEEIAQVDRIAYVNANGDLITVDPDGGEPARLTGGLQAGQGSAGAIQGQPLNLNEYYTWPTWSADGTKLAASRVVVSENRAELSVQVMDARTGRSETVYVNDQAALIAEGAPHYIYWAPTGDSLSFLASAPDGLSLLVWDGTPGRAADVIDRGAPLYYQWSKDAGTMALHVGADISLVTLPAEGGLRRSIGSAGGFRVPAISPDGSILAYVASDGGGMALFVAPVDGLEQARKVMDVGLLSAFMWSPDGTQLAVADQPSPRVPYFNRLMLVPVADGPVVTLSAEQVMAFYWAPTGDKVAWVEVNSEVQEMEWVVSPSDGSGAKRLFSFQPSGEVFIMLSFFDQYAHSHSPWSPDGKSLVVAGSKGEAARRSNGRTPTGDRVYVLDVEGGAGPRDLGAGVLAFWSWN